jgi:hypothetical protein
MIQCEILAMFGYCLCFCLYCTASWHLSTSARRVATHFCCYPSDVIVWCVIRCRFVLLSLRIISCPQFMLPVCGFGCRRTAVDRRWPSVHAQIELSSCIEPYCWQEMLASGEWGLKFWCTPYAQIVGRWHRAVVMPWVCMEVLWARMSNRRYGIPRFA